MKRSCVGLLLSLWFTLALSEGAIPVVTIPGSVTADPINLIQTTATAIQTLKMLEQIIRDMQPWGELATGGLREDFESLSATVASMQGALPHDPEAAGGMFEILYPPTPEALCGPEPLEMWRNETQSQTRLALLDTVKSQAELFRQLPSVMFRVFEVLSQVRHTAGNVEGVQTVGQNGSMLMEEQAKIGAVSATFERAMAMEDAYRVTEAAAERCIHAETLASQPRSVPFPMGGGRSR